MRAHLFYLRYVLRHKWFVFIECCKLGIPWSGIIHDLSKFRPSEWFPYVYYFYSPDGSLRQIRDETGYYNPVDTGNAAFDFAWLLHQKRNRHHWQWWLLPEDEGGIKILPMPDKYRREMLADWRGAGKAITGKDNAAQWYIEHRNKTQLHPSTRNWIEEQLGATGTVGLQEGVM